MNDQILISIIIPSYNRQDTISRTIESILNQNFHHPIEIIIGDDNSNFETKEILNDYKRKYSDIINIIFHKHNIGLGANWASCVLACSGKYICNCDNDDYWHNNYKLKIQYEFMESNLEYGVCHTDYRTFFAKSKRFVEEKAFNLENQNELQDSILNGNFNFCNATFMYRSDILKKYINLNDYIKYKFTLQDWNTWMILSAYTKFYCIHVSTATVSYDNFSITRPNSFENLNDRLQKESLCFEYICEKFPDKYLKFQNNYTEHKNRVLLKFCINSNNYFKAKEISKDIELKNLYKIILLNRLFFKFYYLLRKIVK